MNEYVSYDTIMKLDDVECASRDARVALLNAHAAKELGLGHIVSAINKMLTELEQRSRAAKGELCKK